MGLYLLFRTSGLLLKEIHENWAAVQELNLSYHIIDIW